ncbi:MAG: hypothetical protein BWY70_02013 [Bacteroidetes bacterium ADurb.Bin408]|nr:MAG: hypothetical protein BWY70_02013 [Bacteroidetes bacterium ADurb.Bin408]
MRNVNTPIKDTDNHIAVAFYHIPCSESTYEAQVVLVGDERIVGYIVQRLHDVMWLGIFYHAGGHKAVDGLLDVFGSKVCYLINPRQVGILLSLQIGFLCRWPDSRKFFFKTVHAQLLKNRIDNRQIKVFAFAKRSILRFYFQDDSVLYIIMRGAPCRQTKPPHRLAVATGKTQQQHY